jgi:multidrug efflux system membrane fusion protein
MLAYFGRTMFGSVRWLPEPPCMRFSSPVMLALVVVLGALFSVSCGKSVAPAAGAPARPAAPVVVATAEQRDVPVQTRAIGNVEAYQTVQIRSQVNGQIEKILFKEGQDVHKGQLLVQLDKRPFQADLDKAVGQLKRDQAQEEHSQQQSARYTSLEKQGIVSREQAEQMLTQANADSSAVEADKAGVESARVQLLYTDIYAPIDARTGALLINLGNLIKANDTPFLVQLNQVSPIYVTFSVPENSLALIRKYFPARKLTVFAYPNGQTQNPAEGYLSFIDNNVDMTTGTLKLKATFPNKDRRLWPGEFVDAVLQLSVQKDAVVVQTRAIQTGQQGEYVYVVTSQDTAEARPVKTAGTYQDLTVVSDGVKAGERVVINGQLRVTPNAKVLVQSTGPQSNAPTAVSGGGGL